MQPGDLVRIKNANEMWQHLVGKLGIFITKDGNDTLSYIVKPVNCAYKIRFAQEDLEYLGNTQEVVNTFKELNGIGN